MCFKNFLPAFFILCIFFCGCSKPLYDSLWQTGKMNADGNPKEWEIPLRFFDSKSKLQYAITNDSENLYVCIRATDEIVQQKILRSGMKLWLDTTGKNKERTEIIFPLPFERANSGERKGDDSAGVSHHQFQKPDAKTLKSRYEKSQKQMQLIGFNPPIGGVSLLKNESGISAALDWDANGILTYETIIPFKTFYKNKFSSEKILGVTINIPALPAPPMRGGGNHGGGGMPVGGMGGPGGMGGGMHGGGMRGGGMHGSAGGNYGSGATGIMYEENKIKFRMKLAAKNKDF